MEKPIKYYNKPNPIVRAKGKMTPVQQEILALAISKIQVDDTDFKLYPISIEEFKSLSGRDISNIHKQLHEAVERFGAKTMTIGRMTITTSILTLKTFRGESTVYARFDPDLQPYFFELKNEVGYTQIALESIFNLKSVHSKRIYELLKQWQNAKKSITFKIKELREILGIQEYEYKKFSDFDRRVLKVAKKEINGEDSKGNLLAERLTDMIMSYEKIKKGRSIHEIKFNFEIIKSPKQQWKDTFKQLNAEKIAEVRSRTFLDNAKLDDEQIGTLYNIAMEKANQDENNAYRFMVMTYAKVMKYEQEKSLFSYYKKALENNSI